MTECSDELSTIFETRAIAIMKESTLIQTLEKLAFEMLNLMTKWAFDENAHAVKPFFYLPGNR